MRRLGADDQGGEAYIQVPAACHRPPSHPHRETRRSTNSLAILRPFPAARHAMGLAVFPGWRSHSPFFTNT